MYHQVYEVNSGSLRYVSGTCGNDAYGKCVNSWALSVHCVLDLNFVSANSKYRQLQLCDAGASSSYGAARCDALISGCQGSSNPNCHPFFVWSGSKVSESVYQVYELGSGAWRYTSDTCGSGAYGKCGSVWASSVRCVLDLK